MAIERLSRLQLLELELKDVQTELTKKHKGADRSIVEEMAADLVAEIRRESGRSSHPRR